MDEGKKLPYNMQKYENYKEQFKRLDKALTNQFYLEAIFIVYAIIEDRTASILRYEENSIKPRNENGYVSIESKLKKISKIAENKKSLPHKYFSDDLIEQITAWKEQRNVIIHRLMREVLTTEELERLAVEGKTLARQISNRANNYKRAVERNDGKRNLAQ